MNISDLEKSELVDLAAMLSARLAKSVETELAFGIRVKGLERAVDAARKEVFWENRARALSVEAQGWEEHAKQTEALLYEAKSDLENAKGQAEERRRNFQEIMEQRDHARGERDKAKSELEEKRRACEKQTIGHMEAEKEWRASAEIFRTNERRMERELRETRAAVMNEVSAMIPKAVEAERNACREIARGMALDELSADDAILIMNVANKIGERK